MRIVSNAGGLNPPALVEALNKLDTGARIAYVDGDDLLPHADTLGLAGPDGAALLTANAYLGGWGIAEALREGADVVVTGRVTDASLVVGPAAAHFGWDHDDLDALAGATVAGHVLECGAQATGGNYPFFTELDVEHPGFPLAELHADGSSVITKHPCTGGAVTVDTVTAQLLYEIGGPRYAGPDVTTRFDTIELVPDGPDRVRVTGTRGEPPPPETKVCATSLGGFRNEVTLVLTGLDIEAKAELARRQLLAALPARPAQMVVDLVRTDHPDAPTQQQAAALLRIVVADPDSDVVPPPARTRPLGQHRSVSARRRRLAVAGPSAHAGHRGAAAARDRRPRRPVPPVAEPAGGQRRAARPARRGRTRDHPVRSAGQRACRMAAQPYCRRPGAAAVTAVPASPLGYEE